MQNCVLNNIKDHLILDLGPNDLPYLVSHNFRHQSTELPHAVGRRVGRVTEGEAAGLNVSGD